MNAQPTYALSGYAPLPPQAFAPPPQGYAPPPQGYAPQQGYPPTQGYAPPAQPRQAFVAPQQPAGGVVVINNQQSSVPAQPTVHTTIVHKQPREQTNHLVHLGITLLFWPWIIVWIIICISDGAPERLQPIIQSFSQ